MKIQKNSQVRREKFFKKMSLTFWYVMVALCCSGTNGVTDRKKRDKNGLKFADCGVDEDRPLRFYDVRANPVPIITPGTLYVSFRGNITRDLPRPISIELGLIKYLIGIPFPLPCFDNNLGSCLYDNICDKLKTYELMGCPKTLKQYGVQCSCPFQAGEFNIRNLPLNIPKVRGIARAFISVRGSYVLTLRVKDETSRELGCLQLNFAMRKRYKGWLFKI